ALTPNHAMDSQAGVSRRWPLVFLCVGLLHPVELPAGAAPVQDNVPAPSQAFTPRTAVAFYVDLQGASKSAIWKAIEEKAGPLMEELQSLQQAQVSSLRAAQGIMPGFKETNVVELAIAVEGDSIFSGLRTDQLLAFLSGQTEGRLRAQANNTLSRRGQVWFFMAVPKDAGRNLGGGSGANANPMLAGLAQSMDQVRDMNFTFNFGATQVDFEL